MSTTPEWSRPGAHRVAEGVWRIPLPLPNDGLHAVNVYAIADGDGVTLVDGGWALEAAEAALTGALREIGLGPGDIRRFLVTHSHRDHYTNAVAVRRAYGARVLVGIGERPALDRLVNGPPPLRVQLEMLSRHGADDVRAALEARGAGSVRDPGYEPPDSYVVNGEKFLIGDRVIEAIATPGHTRGHLVFLDRQDGLLFAGDHVLPHITPSVAFEVDPEPLALASYLESLSVVRALPDAVLLPAHGPAGDRVHARVDALVTHHDHRLGAVVAAVRSGWRTASDVARDLTWTSRGRTFGQLDRFNQMLAVLETALHLDLAVDRGLANVRPGSVVEYGPPGIDTKII
jgi:glyoxylase-like metal-dependent hydrolase (beta-lactamase superfamily II)